MQIDPKILAIKDEVTAWRRDFHENPEILYEVHRTAKLVAERLRAFGCDEVVEGIGRTGVVGVIKGRGPDKGGSGKVVGLRADMDALPIEEETNLPHRSKVAGKMHACGHDGHTSMLLGAAKHLAATRDFDGTVIVIFQPAEEGGAGGKAMVEDGMMDRWNIGEVYGMHNMPGMKPGSIAMRPGPIMAAADQFTVEIEGVGAHAAAPHLGIDPVLIGSHIVCALQSIASRNADPLKSVVVSTTMFHAGTAFNIIPTRATLTGTIRTLEPAMRDLAEQRFKTIVEGTAKMFGATATINYARGYPATINHDRETGYAAEIAKAAFGAENVNTDIAPMMGGEDFSYMLEARPGAYVFIGNGDTAGLHHPAYDFNDEVLPYGIQLFTDIAKARTAA
jgi:amidohydrolase